MSILAYYPIDDSMDIWFEGEIVHLTHEDLMEYEQIIRECCM